MVAHGRATARAGLITNNSTDLGTDRLPRIPLTGMSRHAVSLREAGRGRNGNNRRSRCFVFLGCRHELNRSPEDLLE